MRKILLFILIVLCLPLNAQVSVTPEAGVSFQSVLINDEFDASSAVLASSCTIASARLDACIGLRFGESHKIQVGMDLYRDFGTRNEYPHLRLSAWYQMNRKSLTLALGVFPRSLMRGTYSTVILSDKARYYNALLEGFMLQWCPGASVFEIALDWNGKLGDNRREEFNVVTAGKGVITPWLSVNWEGMFHHYACSYQVAGVVDDIIIHPFLCAELGQKMGLQLLSFSVGAIAGYQCDRAVKERYIPVGADIVVEAKNWGVGLRNEAYYGASQAPLYGKADANGVPYADNLYMRSSQWQVTPDGRSGFYDKADIYWEPNIGKSVKIRLSFSAHWGYCGFIGHQETISVAVDLNQIRIGGKRRKKE